VRGIVLLCGDVANPPPPATPPLAGGPPLASAFDVVRVPERPGKADIDELLRAVDRAVVVGDDAGLAAVVRRLLRRELLGSVAVGFVPARGSAVAELWGLPTDPADALRLASTGTASAVPLVRDDAGGVLVGCGVLDGVNGVGYCDDQLALRGTARRVEVRPHASAGLEVRVVRGRLRARESTLHGRAFQYGGGPVSPVLDGVQRERPLPRWTWYRHTEDLLLVR
jgi:hypothetical protein